MEEENIIFGKKEKGVDYIRRIGIYAVIFNSMKNKIAIVKTKRGYFLPGGGLNQKEKHKECLHRESLEEMGWKIKVGEYLGSAGNYYYSTTNKDYYYSDGYFYFAEKLEKFSEPTEKDHKVVWLNFQDAIKKMYHKNQAWAIKKALSVV